MKFVAREFDKKADAFLLAKWQERRGLPVNVDMEFLPPTGVLVLYYEQPVCAGFMIRCDNGMVINSDFIADPDVPNDLRNAAVEYMRQTLYKEAMKQGFKMVTVFTSIGKHVERLKGKGFLEIDKNLVQLGRILWR